MFSIPCCCVVVNGLLILFHGTILAFETIQVTLGFSQVLTVTQSHVIPVVAVERNIHFSRKSVAELFPLMVAISVLLIL